MVTTILVWLACSAIAFAAVLLLRRSRLHRGVRKTDLDWKAVLVMALIVGALPAFVFDQVNRRSVDVPESVQPAVP
jgi:glucan phosphoethanolaminetransferase (alkaline phosphatase superfamily)